MLLHFSKSRKDTVKIIRKYSTLVNGVLFMESLRGLIPVFKLQYVPVNTSRHHLDDNPCNIDGRKQAGCFLSN